MYSFVTASQRTTKPRQQGITEIMDVGTPLSLFSDYIRDFHPYIDFIKLGIGSAVITPHLTEKIAIARDYDIEVWFGGTLFEKFYQHRQLSAYKDFLQRHKVQWVEISNGILNLPHHEVLQCIERFNQDFQVVAEVGSKDRRSVMSSQQWLHTIEDYRALNCRYIILEGRSSANSGLYHHSGEIRETLVADIVARVDPKYLIFEAPHVHTQGYFIRHYGSHVNLGNITFADILTLESQRQGLRYETFFLHQDSSAS